MLVGVIGLVAIPLVIEATALLLLYRNIAGYKLYWQQKAKVSGEFTYIALGDSAAQGIGATPADNGYVGLIAKDVAHKTGKTVRIINVSKSGAVVQDVLRNQLPAIKGLKPDLVTIEIGANDVAAFSETKFKSEFTELVRVLPPGTFVSNLPYFGSRAKRRPIAHKASQIIDTILASQTRVTRVDLESITKQRDSIFGYAADYFHPNNRAYRNWAEAFWYKIEPTIQ